MIANPRDPRLLAFVAVSGSSQWSGELDCATHEILHMHRIPDMNTYESNQQPLENARKCRLKAAWLSSSHTLIAGLISLTDLVLIISSVFEAFPCVAGSINSPAITATYFSDHPSFTTTSNR